MSTGSRGSNIVFGKYFLYIKLVMTFQTINIVLFFFFILVGNIPYELTEDQLTEVFKEVGPVLSFRYVLHKVFTLY